MFNVSIILTIFNNSKFLSKCIISILKQSYAPKEIILVDDGSADNEAKKIYKKFKSTKNIDFKFYKIKNKGSSGARNFALKKIRYNYFCFFDPDDYMGKNFIKNKIKIFEKYGGKKIVGVYSNIKFKKKSDVRLNNYQNGWGDFNQIDTIGHKNGICGSLPTYLFYKPNMPNNIRLYKKILINEDFDLIIRLLLKKKKVFGINKFDIIVNLHDYSLTRSIKNNNLIYDNQKKFLSKAYKKKYFSSKELTRRRRYAESLMIRSSLKRFDLLSSFKYFYKYLII